MCAHLPQRPSQIDKVRAVELQLLNRGASDGCQTTNLSEIACPCKVFGPGLAAGVKKTYIVPCRWVEGSHGGELAVVAALAAEGEVVERIAAARHLGLNVLNRKIVMGQLFLAATVFAAMTCAPGNLFSPLSGYAGHAQEVTGCG